MKPTRHHLLPFNPAPHTLMRTRILRIALVLLAALGGTGPLARAQTQAPHGTPLLWLQSRGLTGDPAAAELADSDGDGQPNWEEYLAGTDPTNALSVLRLQASLPAEGAVRLSFTAGLARRFQVESSADLRHWSAVGAPVLGEGQDVWVLDDQPRAGSQRFYHVRVLGSSVVPGMVWLPAGRFVMGSPVGEPGRNLDEGPQTTVTLSRDFWMLDHEVSQREYLALLGANPAAFTGDLELPVESVSWDNATNYCARLTAQEKADGRLPRGYQYRLPTEAEWEYACRAGTTNATAFGGQLSSTQANFDGRYPYNWAPAGPYLGHPTPAGTYAPNAWGLSDMHGNVNEWCGDWYAETLPGGSVTNPAGPATGITRVARSGCWDMRGSICRSASRLNGRPEEGGEYLGFRVVLAAVPGYGQASVQGTVTDEVSGIPLAGVTVCLLNADFPADTNNYANNQPALLATNVTDAAGQYAFQGLRPGHYLVAPAPLTSPEVRSFAWDTNSQPPTFSLGSAARTVNFLAQEPVPLDLGAGPSDSGRPTTASPSPLRPRIR